MNTWHCKSLGDALTASIELREIEQAFARIAQSEGTQIAIAVFTRQEPGPLHCEVIAYFSPAALALARQFGAQPCNPPNRPGLELLDGDANCWPSVFPE